MYIEVDTKFSIGDSVWTGGYSLDDASFQEIPVPCVVDSVTVCAWLSRGQVEYHEKYALVPIFKYQHTIIPPGIELEPTYFPYDVNCDFVFSTYEECVKGIESQLPF